MSDPILSVLVGIPAYGGLARAESLSMYFELGHAFASAEDRFRFVGFKLIDSQPIDRVRNMLVDEARLQGADWLLMIDTDVWVESSSDEPAGLQLLRMISQADRRNAIIVGANVQKRDGSGVMSYRKSPTSGRLLQVDIGRGNWKLDVSADNSTLDVADAVGTSIFAINVKRLPSGYTFRFADVSEDLFMCRLVNENEELGPDRILVDGRVRTAHMGRPTPLKYP